MSLVRIGIIGTGYWGPNLVRNFFQNEHCEISCCCDKDPKRLAQIKKQFPSILITQNSETIFQDKNVDAVIIATPSNTHADLVIAALKHGKHVFVEKPFALATSEVKKILLVQKKFKKYVMVGHTYEYNPAILQIKKYIQEGLLGDLYYVYGSRLNLGKVREETNALWNLAPHDFSIIRFLLDTVPTSVSAFGQPYLQKKHEDVVFINMRFPHNVLAHFHVSWLDPSKERKMTLVGSKKMIIFDDMDNEVPIRIYDKGFIQLVNEKGERMFKEFSLKLRPGDVHLPYIESKEPLREECNHFIDCIINKKRPRSDERAGFEVVKMLEAAQKSLDSGGKWIHTS